MTFTGTLIEDLMAKVERAEQRAQADALTAEPESRLVERLFAEPWLATGQENADCDSKLIGAA